MGAPVLRDTDMLAFYRALSREPGAFYRLLLTRLPR